jgi:hypothetical protein
VRHFSPVLALFALEGNTVLQLFSRVALLLARRSG